MIHPENLAEIKILCEWRCEKHFLCREQPMLHFHVIVQSAAKKWNVTFDEALAAFEQISGIFIEPDGSFFRASRPEMEPWQVEGNLYDQGAQLAYVELKGSCPEQRLDEFLRPLGWPDTPLTFQLVREGLCLNEAEFRKAASK